MSPFRVDGRALRFSLPTRTNYVKTWRALATARWRSILLSQTEVSPTHWQRPGGAASLTPSPSTTQFIVELRLGATPLTLDNLKPFNTSTNTSDIKLEPSDEVCTYEAHKSMLQAQWNTSELNSTQPAFISSPTITWTSRNSSLPMGAIL